MVPRRAAEEAGGQTIEVRLICHFYELTGVVRVYYSTRHRSAVVMLTCNIQSSESLPTH